METELDHHNSLIYFNSFYDWQLIEEINSGGSKMDVDDDDDDDGTFLITITVRISLY